MKKLQSLFLCVIMFVGFSVPAFAYDASIINTIINDTANYVYKTADKAQFGSVGGEWAVLGLARSGAAIPDGYYREYYQNVEEYVRACGGILHEKKYTEYSRLIIALTAIGKDPSDVSGFNLLTPLGDYNKTVWQGINGAIWALIALDSGNYDMPQNLSAPVQATRQMYINYILEKQTSDGGWAITGDFPDSDITAMALQALAKYQSIESVQTAIQRALSYASQVQDSSGGFMSGDTNNSESCVQMIVALCELGIPLDDERFVKNGNTMLDNLLTYYDEDGRFKHTYDGGSNQMATEQALYGLAAAKRLFEGRESLYRMSDAAAVTESDGKTSVIFAVKTSDNTTAREKRYTIEALTQAFRLKTR